MTNVAEKLFDDQPAGDVPAEGYGKFSTGIIPSHILRREIRLKKLVVATEEIEEAQIQPASLDLRLGRHAYRVRASFLPGAGMTVEKKLQSVAMHKIDISEGAVLEAGCVYVVPLIERLELRDRISGIANPKSSTGRLDVFTRLITDGAQAFDSVETGYRGPLYAEITPRTFPVLVRKGSRLNQLRLRSGSPQSSDTELRKLHALSPLVDMEPNINNGLALSIDLEGAGRNSLVGWRAKRHTGVVDVDKDRDLNPFAFWDPVSADESKSIVLDPEEFYILVSREKVAIPLDYAAEMVPFDPLVGEFRVHYAGFFDPGFGLEPGKGPAARAVLEVRSREVPFILEHGQVIGRLVFERLTDPPLEAYGQGIGSNYQRQGLKLSKHFRQPD